MSSEFIANNTYQSDHSSALGFVWPHIRRHPRVGIGMVIGAFSNAALASAVPLLLGRAFEALNAGDITTVGWLCLTVIGSQFTRGALQLMRNFSSETFSQRIERD